MSVGYTVSDIFLVVFFPFENTCYNICKNILYKEKKTRRRGEKYWSSPIEFQQFQLILII